MTDLNGKTALVTGASRGIGRASALALAKDGAQVLIHYSSGEKEADAVVAEIRASGGKERGSGRPRRNGARGHGRSASRSARYQRARRQAGTSSKLDNPSDFRSPSLGKHSPAADYLSIENSVRKSVNHLSKCLI